MSGLTVLHRGEIFDYVGKTDCNIPHVAGVFMAVLIPLIHALCSVRGDLRTVVLQPVPHLAPQRLDVGLLLFEEFVLAFANLMRSFLVVLGCFRERLGGFLDLKRYFS